MQEIVSISSLTELTAIVFWGQQMSEFNLFNLIRLSTPEYYNLIDGSSWWFFYIFLLPFSLHLLPFSGYCCLDICSPNSAC